MPDIQEKGIISWSELARLYEFDPKVLATGGFGAIYAGRKRSTGEDVVLKICNIQGCTMRRFHRISPPLCEELKKYVIREWDALINLSHPNIVQAKDEYIYIIKDKCRCGGSHDSVDDPRDDIFIIIMERMDRDVYDTMHYFQDYRQSSQRLKLTSFGQLARRIFFHIAKALDYLHQKPILHRDVSWGNVMLKIDQMGKVTAKLVDLGLSRDLPRTHSGLSSENIGTLAFCAPELYYSELKTCGYGTRVDVWSLGIVLYLMLTGNCDKHERSLRFRETIDAIENIHDLCIEARRAGTEQTCTFCGELTNDRFAEAIPAAELQIKKDALPLLEGMLKVNADDRFSTKQVLSHDWLADERQADPRGVEAEEEIALPPIARHDVTRCLQVTARKFEYSYLRDPDCTILASSYRHSAKSVSLGDVTTFGGILSRLGVNTGEKVLQVLPDYDKNTYLVCLDGGVPRKHRGVYFRHAYLCLLDCPNGCDSIYRAYRALRTINVPDTKTIITPLIGFDFMLEEDSPYRSILGDRSRRKFVLQQWLSFAFYISRTTDIEKIVLLSWRHITYNVVKETLLENAKPFLPPPVFDDDTVQTYFRSVGGSIRQSFASSVLIRELQLQPVMDRLLDLLANINYAEPRSSSEAERQVCQEAGKVGTMILSCLQDVERSKYFFTSQEDREHVYFCLLTLHSNVAKQGIEEGPSLINRVDVSRTLDSLITVLSAVQTQGDIEARAPMMDVSEEDQVREMSF